MISVYQLGLKDRIIDQLAISCANDDWSVIGTISSGNEKIFDIKAPVYAENIKLSHDLSLIGEYTLGNMKKTVDDICVIQSGTNVYEMLSSIFTGQKPDYQPSKIDPKMNMTFSGATKEVGSSYGPITCKLSCNNGFYTYDSDTGVVYQLSVKDSLGNTLTAQNNTQLTVCDSVKLTSAGTYVLTGIMNYSDGKVAKTKNGNDSNPPVQISANQNMATGQVNFKYAYFYGGLQPDKTLEDPSQIGSDLIRALPSGASMNYSTKAQAKQGTKQYFFAFQKDDANFTNVLNGTKWIRFTYNSGTYVNLTNRATQGTSWRTVKTADPSISAEYAVFYGTGSVPLDTDLQFAVDINVTPE